MLYMDLEEDVFFLHFFLWFFKLFLRVKNYSSNISKVKKSYPFKDISKALRLIGIEKIADKSCGPFFSQDIMAIQAKDRGIFYRPGDLFTNIYWLTFVEFLRTSIAKNVNCLKNVITILLRHFLRNMIFFEYILHFSGILKSSLTQTKILNFCQNLKKSISWNFFFNDFTQWPF